jgi:hypothetical protein
LTPILEAPVSNLGRGSGSISFPGDNGLIVRGLFGDPLLVSKDSVELKDSLVFIVVCENVEEIELVRVLGLLSGSRTLSGRIGVDGLEGRGSKLGRRGAFTVSVFTLIVVA